MNRKAMNRALRKRGLGDLSDPTLFDQLAAIISHLGEELGHAKFRALLTVVEPEKRRTAYQALAPKLSFKARPLDDYLRESAEQSIRQHYAEYDPITHTLKTMEPARTADLERSAEKAILWDLHEQESRGRLKLRCHKCTKEESFPGGNRFEALTLAEKCGWITEEDQAICADCKPVIYA